MSQLTVSKLSKTYQIKKLFQKDVELLALNQISFSLESGKTLGVVGESGCGKSTLARVLTGLESFAQGSIQILGKDISTLDRKALHTHIQMVFQDPYQSLNPRKTARDIIADPLLCNFNLSKNEIDEKVTTIMQKVGLREDYKKRYPHHLSGGQRQRLGIARALMLRPEILILDEPVSALDVSIQAQVLNLLLELQKEFNLSYIFIGHDLSVVSHVSDQILVMYLGKIVEYGPSAQVFGSPKHPYTKLLLESAPKMFQHNIHKVKLPSNLSNIELPSALNLPKGCSFAPRCPHASDKCKDTPPELQNKDELHKTHAVACYHPLS